MITTAKDVTLDILIISQWFIHTNFVGFGPVVHEKVCSFASATCNINP